MKPIDVPQSLHLNTSMSLPPAHLPPSAWTGHLPFAMWVVDALRPQLLVELGTHHGASYLAFCQAVRHCGLDTRCYAVDTWEGDEHSGHYGEDVFRTLQDMHQAEYSGFSSLMRMRFDEALPYFADGSVDLLHIDGLHTYEAVRADFESWLPKISGRGVVLFHDILVRERGFGVWRLWAELQQRYPWFEFRHAHGLGVLLVGEEQPESLRRLAGLSDEARVPVQLIFESLGERALYKQRALASEHYGDLARAEAERNRAECEKAYRMLADEREAWARTRSELEAAIQESRQAHVDARARATALQERLADVEAGASARLLSERDSWVAKYEAIAAERDLLLAQRARSEDLQWQLSAALQGAEALRSAYRSEIDSARALLEIERERVAEAERERDALRGALDQARSELHDAVARLDAESGLRAAAERESSARRLELEGMRRTIEERRNASLKSRAGRSLRALYLSLPMSWNTRLALKSLAFRAFAPLLRHTNAYRRWQYHRPTQAPVDRSSHAPSGGAARVADSPDTPVAAIASDAVDGAYVSQVLGIPAERAPGYVARPADAPPDALRAKAIAFYLPQFHPIPENDAWWGPGFTEWTNVSKAVPQFLGHEQPKLPGELGFYDLRLPEVMRRQAELAKLHGIHGFCFHYYWFSGRRLLERPLDGFLADKTIDLPFCLCWANENWTRRWDGLDADILVEQRYSEESDRRFIADAAPYLRDERYIRVDGRLLLILYRPSLLPDARRTLEIWRDSARELGLGELFVAMVQFDVEDPRTYGFDAALEFPPHKLATDMPTINDALRIVNPDYSGMVLDYRELSRRARNWPRPDYPLFRGLSPQWDNEARKPGRGYTFANASPEAYGEWLRACVEYAESHPVEGESIVFVNAWNEWGEGAYLEPDRRYGYAYLHATRDALAGARHGARIAVVSHDAHPHGAQYLALNIARELRALGVEVELVLLGDGVLIDDYRRVADTTIVDPRDPAALRALAEAFEARGVRSAIVNTAVSGDVVGHFADAGIRCVALIHELSGVIAQYGLQPQVETIAAKAESVVFAAEEVRAGFERHAALPAGKVAIRPQGLYKRNGYVGDSGSKAARRALRERLRIPASARIVLCVGYADARKGADLFVEACSALMARHADIHAVWVGHIDEALRGDIDRAIARSGNAERFHFVGRDSDTDVYYAGADLYALTSREDPYPSVVMEAFEVGLPVVGFENTGGLDRLIASLGGGLAPQEDAAAFAAACEAVLSDPARAQRISERCARFVAEECSFRHYVFDLLRLCDVRLPKVSVVVPNYNYARYLRQRIESILAQRFPIYELIVLDDASTDDSLEVVERIAAAASLPIRIVRNRENSGSVFRQWHKGCAEARGEFVWIAEADDLAEPDFLAALMPAFADPDVVMAYTQSMQIDADGAVLAPDYLGYTDGISKTRWLSSFKAGLQDELRSGFAVKNTVPNVSAVVFRRDNLLDTLSRHIDEIASYCVAGDWLTYIRLLEAGKIHFHPESLNRHRRHDSSVTLGRERLPHVHEVAAVQAIAAEYGVPAAIRDAAREYILELARYIGVDPDEATRPVHEARVGEHSW